MSAASAAWAQVNSKMVLSKGSKHLEAEIRGPKEIRNPNQHLPRPNDGGEEGKNMDAEKCMRFENGKTGEQS